MKLTIRGIRRLIREALLEVDLDPANNPGRPDDPYAYLGMHPTPTAAMSHPYADGAGPQGSSADTASAPAGGDVEPIDVSGNDNDAAPGDEA